MLYSCLCSFVIQFTPLEFNNHPYCCSIFFLLGVVVVFCGNCHERLHSISLDASDFAFGLGWVHFRLI